MSDPHPTDLPADTISVRAYFLTYLAGLAVAVAVLILLIHQEDPSWQEWKSDPVKAFTAISPAVKLLGFAIYLSLCCTFIPLPTSWIVAAVATRQAAVAAGVWGNEAVVAAVTTLLVATAGAVGSAVANLNDYHIFTLLLRHGKIAGIRLTRSYQKAAKWFGRSPFFLLVLFNVIPIPVDVVRMLATTYRYPRGPFSLANFIGRFIRYAVIAFVTFWWNLGWIAVLTLLALATIMAIVKILQWVPQRFRPNPPAAGLSGSSED